MKLSGDFYKMLQLRAIDYTMFVIERDIPVRFDAIESNVFLNMK